jgi:hypothetical protein
MLTIYFCAEHMNFVPLLCLIVSKLFVSGAMLSFNWMLFL